MKKIFCTVAIIFSLFSAFPVASLATAAETDVSLPDFLKNVRSQEDFDALSDEQKVEAERLLSEVRVGPGVAGTGFVSLPDTDDCFNYYRFGSVQVDLSPSLGEAMPGTPLTFFGTIVNENPYPLVDGSVYVKIFKVGEEDFTQENGYPLVAFFKAKDGMQLKANGQEEVSFDWKVPEGLSGGEYEAAFFFVTSNRFNLLGLSFTDDVTGNKSSFKVVADDDRQVVFDKNSVILNDEPYRFAAFPPHLTIDEPAVFMAKVTNPSPVEKTISLTWNLYNWDGLREDQLLDSRAETVMFGPGETKTVTYTATRQAGSVSYIVATLKDGEATSIIDPRFVRDNIEEVRLNFPSLYTFPLVAGEENKVFSCLHATNVPLVEDNILTVTLTDEKTGEVIHTYQYEGAVTGDMVGVVDTFVPERSYGKVRLTTVLKKSGELVDTVSQVYDCAKLSPESCVTEDAPHATTNENFFRSPTFVFILFVILIGFVGFLWFRERKNVKREDIIDDANNLNE